MHPLVLLSSAQQRIRPTRRAPFRAACCAALSVLVLVLVVSQPAGALPAVTVVAPADGNVATLAKPSATGGSGVGGLIDGRSTPVGYLGTSWTSPVVSPSHSVELRWTQTQTIISMQLVGAPGTDSRILAGTLSFSDGTSVSVGELVRDAKTPTTVAFRTKKVTWVRFTITKVEGSGTIGIGELRAYRTKALPARPTTPSSSTLAATVVNPRCAPVRPTTRTAGLVYVLCPLTNTRVNGIQTVSFLAPGFTKVAVSVWAASSSTSPTIATAKVDRLGSGSVRVPFNRVEGGPVTLQLTGVEGPNRKVAVPTRLQLYNDSRDPAGAVQPATSALGASRSLVYAEEFNSAISYSLEGRNPAADYPAAKPEYWGTGQFGDAIFPDPAKKFNTLKIVDGRYLRMTTEPNPTGYTDPSRWGRKYIGGLLGSARAGGSGFGAQYGYFEARMLAPANPGTWPAFWMLPTNNLVAYQRQVAEIDVIELYGNNPTIGCHAVHAYTNSNDKATVNCGRRFADARRAAQWHVYGADVTPTQVTFYVDGVKTVTIPQVAGGDQPMFFMINATLGGGWPIKLDTVHNRSATYVDYVRVYV